MATYINTHPDDFHAAVVDQLIKLRPTLKHFPSGAELANHWDDYRSVEDTAQEWLDWADANP